MKIIEGLKELKQITEKLDKNADMISLYASALDNEKLPFETEDKQRKQINEYIQSSKDLISRYLQLKTAIDKTNMETKVQFDFGTFTIHDLILLNPRNAKAARTGNYAGAMLAQPYTALTTDQADRRLHMLNRNSSSDSIKVLRFYDEEAKNKELYRISDFLGSISARLEVINATTDIIGL